MRQTFSILLRILACAGVTYLVWRQIGTVGVVTCAPLFGIALARPIMDFIGESVWFGRRLAMRDLEGRHFEYKGKLVDVVEDTDNYRWLRLDDIRHIVKGLPADQVLEKLLPKGLQRMEPSAYQRIKADALLDNLQKSTDPSTIRFKTWIEREVVFPARKQRDKG